METMITLIICAIVACALLWAAVGVMWREADIKTLTWRLNKKNKQNAHLQAKLNLAIQYCDKERMLELSKKLTVLNDEFRAKMDVEDNL